MPYTDSVLRRYLAMIYGNARELRCQRNLRDLAVSAAHGPTLLVDDQAEFRQHLDS